MYYAVMMERVHKRQPVQDPLQFYRNALSWWIATSEANSSKPEDQQVQLYFPAPASYETMLWIGR